MHEVYHHASDPERKNIISPCNQLNLTSLSSPLPITPCDVPLNEDDLSSPCTTEIAHGSTSISGCPDRERIVTAVHKHTVAEMNAIASSYQTNLTFLRENNIEYNLYSQAGYLQLVESLVAVGGALPFRETMTVLSDVLKSSNCYFIKRMRNFLCQNHCVMCSLPHEKTVLWDTINQSLEILKNAISKEHVDPSQTPAFQASKTVLEYLLNIFIDDLMHHFSEVSNGTFRTSLFEKVLSSTSKWSWFNKMLSMAFSLLDLNILAKCGVLECLDTLLGLALLPLKTCNSKAEQEEISTTLAKQLSQRIERLSNSFKKIFVLLRIPSEHVRLKVIDIHLDNYFATAGTTSTGSDSSNEGMTSSSTDFSLSKFKVHLQKTVVRGDGTRQDLGFFLSLLTMLLQSHLLIVSGAPMLSFLPDRESAASEGNSSSAQLQPQLTELNQSVTVFINRLSTDPATASYLITPTNWNYLELLIILTS